MNFENMSTESLKEMKVQINKALESKKQCENYTVGHFSNVTFYKGYHNLVFGNGCEVVSLFDGDGVYILDKYIKKVEYDNNGIIIYFKDGKQ